MDQKAHAPIPVQNQFIVRRGLQASLEQLDPNVHAVTAFAVLTVDRIAVYHLCP